MITAAVFAMLFSLLQIFFLHAEAAGRQCFGKAIRFPRTLLWISSFLALLLYIVVVATWYNRCYNNISEIYWRNITNDQTTTSSPTIGYAVATAIAAIVFSFLAWCFNFWRTCSPNKNEPVSAPKVKQPSAEMNNNYPPGPLSPGASATPYAQQASASNLGTTAALEDEGGSNPYGTSGGYGGGGGAYSNGSGGGGAYGGGAYGGGNDASYSNDASAEGGYTSGGYGGGGSGYGGKKQESAYGY